jgi:cellulose synthase/poly-beta-1,6-N-acetylglucosamine synthase-like glycosyltransferase
MAAGELMRDAALLEWIFWLSVAGVLYAYIGYPLLLRALTAVFSRDVRAASGSSFTPTVSMIIPVHNERPVIEGKLLNTLALDYPPAAREVIFVADGCTDGTAEYLREHRDDAVKVLEINARGGKAGALNAGRAAARFDLVVFSDASIALEPGALRAIVRPFADPAIGCVSGEDRIEQAGGEGLYGRYELWIRRQESRLHSIVGASGSFYAQRREICEPFAPGLAPDFLSVLRTIERGYRAIAVADASGLMRATTSQRDEFNRKVRTLLRGMTTLREYAHLMNPLKYGWFAFALASHKLVRWLVPVFLIAAAIANALLAPGSLFYLALLLAQVAFYASAAGALVSYGPVAGSLPVKVSAYFTTVTVATMAAWLKYFAGTRQEVWTPTRR